MPALCLLSLLGVAVTLGSLARSTTNGARLAFIPLAGAVASWAPVLMSYTLTQRYLHDLVPFLVLSSAIGVAAAARWNPALRWSCGTAILPLGLASILVNCSTALHYQRDQDGAPARYHVAFHRWKHDVDRALHGEALPAHEIEIGAEAGRVLHCVAGERLLPSDPVKGQKVLLVRERQIRIHDGTEWKLAPWDGSLWEKLEVHCDMAFPDDPDSPVEPICLCGRKEMNDMIFVEYLDDGRLAFGIERRGAFRQVGQPQAISPNKQGRLRATFDSLTDRLTVTWNDQEVLAVACPANRPRHPNEIEIGSNPVGHAASARFSGHIAGVESASALECEPKDR